MYLLQISHLAVTGALVWGRPQLQDWISSPFGGRSLQAKQILRASRAQPSFAPQDRRGVGQRVLTGQRYFGSSLRRSSFSTATRIKAASWWGPMTASIRRIVSAGKRTVVCFKPSDGRPIGSCLSAVRTASNRINGRNRR